MGAANTLLEAPRPGDDEALSFPEAFPPKMLPVSQDFYHYLQQPQQHPNVYSKKVSPLNIDIFLLSLSSERIYIYYII